MTCLHLVVKHQDMNTSAYFFILLLPLLTVGQFIADILSRNGHSNSLVDLSRIGGTNTLVNFPESK